MRAEHAGKCMHSSGVLSLFISVHLKDVGFKSACQKTLFELKETFHTPALIGHSEVLSFSARVKKC